MTIEVQDFVTPNLTASTKEEYFLDQHSSVKGLPIGNSYTSLLFRIDLHLIGRHIRFNFCAIIAAAITDGTPWNGNVDRITQS